MCTRSNTMYRRFLRSFLLNCGMLRTHHEPYLCQQNTSRVNIMIVHSLDQLRLIFGESSVHLPHVPFFA